MYGPPPECKKNWVEREAVCENVSGLLVENRLRAHDDDPRVPVLVNRHGRERPCYASGSQARRLTVFSSFLFFCRLVRSEFQAPSSSWKRQRLGASDDSFLRLTA